MPIGKYRKRKKPATFKDKVKSKARKVKAAVVGKADEAIGRTAVSYAKKKAKSKIKSAKKKGYRSIGRQVRSDYKTYRSKKRSGSSSRRRGNVRRDSKGRFT